jgi:hypothetical protein
MNDYVIGAGAILTAGPHASIAGATLHAQTERSLAPTVKAAIVDFESSSLDDLSRLIVLAAGFNAARVKREIVAPLVDRCECTLSDVFATLAQACHVQEVHVFARWLPDGALMESLERHGVTVVWHSLDSIRQAALVSGQTYSRWPTPLRAA